MDNNNKSTEIISFDIGGTNCHWIKFVDGKEVQNGCFKTQSKNKQFVLNKLSDIIEKNSTSNTKIAISSPTAVNTKTGDCYGISGIEEYGNFNLYKELKEKLNKYKKIKIRAVNDANAALLGSISEFERDVTDAILITIGTGIGGAIYINNKIFSGKNGFAGEFGYAKSPVGNLSQLVSTSALCRMVKEKTGLNLSGKEIWQKQKTNIKVQKVLNEWMNNLLDFLFQLTVSFNPDTIFIGGGISSNIEFIYELRSKLELYLSKEDLIRILPSIAQASNGSKAGIYGAHCLWKKI